MDLDVLRGQLLVWMALNHVPCALWFLVQQPVGFVTAAEAFILLAGILVGHIYSERFITHGKTSTTRLLMRRVGVIYGAHLLTVAGVLVWMGSYAILVGNGQPPVASPWAWFDHPWQALAATLLLIHQPGLLDVLPLYCGCLLITPLALRQLMRGRRNGLLVGSAALWAFTNVAVPGAPTIYGVINTGAFNFGAWQFLFIIGITAGHAHRSGELPRLLRPRRALCIIGASIALWLLAARHGWCRWGLPSWFWAEWSNKNDLAPLRLLNVLALAVLLRALLMTRPDRPPVLALRNRLLALLGRHSLAVFSIHAVVAIMILGLPAWFEWSRWGPWLGPVLLLIAMITTAEIAERLARRKRLRQPAPP